MPVRTIWPRPSTGHERLLAWQRFGKRCSRRYAALYQIRRSRIRPPRARCGVVALLHRDKIVVVVEATDGRGLVVEPGQSCGKGPRGFQRGMAQFSDDGAGESLEAELGRWHAQFVGRLVHLAAQQVVGDQQPQISCRTSSGRLLRKTVWLACMRCLISRKPSSTFQRWR